MNHKSTSAGLKRPLRYALVALGLAAALVGFLYWRAATGAAMAPATAAAAHDIADGIPGGFLIVYSQDDGKVRNQVGLDADPAAAAATFNALKQALRPGEILACVPSLQTPFITHQTRGDIFIAIVVMDRPVIEYVLEEGAITVDLQTCVPGSASNERFATRLSARLASGVMDELEAMGLEYKDAASMTQQQFRGVLDRVKAQLASKRGIDTIEFAVPSGQFEGPGLKLTDGTLQHGPTDRY